MTCNFRHPMSLRHGVLKGGVAGFVGYRSTPASGVGTCGVLKQHMHRNIWRNEKRRHARDTEREIGKGGDVGADTGRE